MQIQTQFRSLRFRLLTPMILVALVAATLVAIMSYELGHRWASDDVESRFASIETTIADSRFPLNATVLGLLAELTQTELVGLGEFEQVRYATIELAPNFQGQRAELESWVDRSGRRYRLLWFDTVGGAARPDGVAKVGVLFDEQQIDASRRRAALLPLVTGLSTILAVSSISLVLTSRLVRRIGRLQRRVERVAGGDFESTVSDSPSGNVGGNAGGNVSGNAGGNAGDHVGEVDNVGGVDNVGDEVGRLGLAVDSMAGQLDGLWKRVNQQQGEKLLHQIAGGMAHQLRNSLTGARMAVELHAADCGNAGDESLRVAISQIEQSEDYVRRLLLVASGRQDEDRPTDVITCFHDVRKSLTPIARHLKIDIDWEVTGERLPAEGNRSPAEGNRSPAEGNRSPAEGDGNPVVGDGPTWVAAVTNLVQNAMQSGDRVSVKMLVTDQSATVTVADNGPGVDDAIAPRIFEPLVTSKPEGIGLGLPLVKRAAEQLGGQVRWHRQDERTVFVFQSQVIACQ